MPIVNRLKIWAILGAVVSFQGCASIQDAQILDERIYSLHLQVNTIKKERETIKRDFSAFQKEAEGNFATLRSDFSGLQTEMNQKITKIWTDLSLTLESVQSQLNASQKEDTSFRKELSAFQKETEAQISTLKKESFLLKTDLSKETKNLQAEITKETKGLQADLRLQFETLQSEIQKLSAGVEEYREFITRPSKEIQRVKEDIASLTKTFTKTSEERWKVFEEKSKVQEGRILSLEEKQKVAEDSVRRIEDFLKRVEDFLKRVEDRLRGLEGRIDKVAVKQEELEKSTPSKDVSSEAKHPATLIGNNYKDAYKTFQQGDLEGARRKFEAFLKQYPNTELSDNAQFWIGETYYLQKDFEKAILEYEKAIAKYSAGDKIPAALFKQALAFLELGDKTNARNILKRVIERYPQSDQAESAKKKLEEMK